MVGKGDGPWCEERWDGGMEMSGISCFTFFRAKYKPTGKMSLRKSIFDLRATPRRLYRLPVLQQSTFPPFLSNSNPSPNTRPAREHLKTSLEVFYR